MVTLAAPTGLISGDVEIAQITLSGDETITSVPSGWSLVRQDTTGVTFNDLRQALYSHVASASEPTVYSWGASGPSTWHAAGGLTAWTGVDPASPVVTSTGTTSNYVPERRGSRQPRLVLAAQRHLRPTARDDMPAWRQRDHLRRRQLFAAEPDSWTKLDDV